MLLADTEKFWNSCFRNGLLLHHSFIADNEIHLKIGGDHGGGSFKMCYEIVNTKNPNCKENTVVFSLFEAKDYRCNINISLARFKEQISNLQKIKWRYSNFKSFWYFWRHIFWIQRFHWE